MLAATAWCGIFYALVGGMPIVRYFLFLIHLFAVIVDSTNPFFQPLLLCALFIFFIQMINGGTGPVLAFSGVLFKLSKSMDVPFLTFNAWVGLWV